MAPGILKDKEWPEPTANGSETIVGEDRTEATYHWP